MIERIRDRAGTISPGQAIRQAAVFPFWLTGILIGGLLTVAWSAVRWAWAALLIGISDAAGDRLPKPSASVVAQWAVVFAIVIGVIVVWIS